MTAILPPSGSIYSETLNAFFYDDNFSTLSSTVVPSAIIQSQNLPAGTTIWQLYLASVNLPTDTLASTATAAQQSAFITFAQNFNQSDLWLQFLRLLGKPPTYNPDTDPDLTVNDKEAVQVRFLNYVKATLQNLQLQQINLTSPDEVKKRIIMFALFNLLIEMLDTLQNTVGVVANNLIFYGKWQEAYTNMLTKVPTYVGGSSDAPSTPPGGVNINTLSQFTFGYAGISGTDIANWAANALQGTVPATFKMQMPPSALDSLMAQIQSVDSLDGDINTAKIANIKAQIVNNSFLEFKVDPVNQSVTFSIGGINLEQFQSSPAANPTFGDSANSDFSIHMQSGGGQHITVDNTDASTTGNDLTVDVTAGEQYQQGHFHAAGSTQSTGNLTGNTVLVDANGFAQYATTSNTAQVAISGTDFNSKVTSIENAFVNFWNSPATQGSTTAGTVTGIRLQVDQQWLYNVPLLPANTTTIGSSNPSGHIETPGSNVWFSDYKFNSQRYDYVVPSNDNSWQTGSVINTPVTLAGPVTDVTPTIAWTKNTTSDPDSKARAEVNARLQQYIENIRSNRQVVANIATQIQNTLSQAKDSISNTGNLLSSILDSLKGIASAIFSR